MGKANFTSNKHSLIANTPDAIRRLNMLKFLVQHVEIENQMKIVNIVEGEEEKAKKKVAQLNWAIKKFL